MSSSEIQKLRHDNVIHKQAWLFVMTNLNVRLMNGLSTLLMEVA